MKRKSSRKRGGAGVFKFNGGDRVAKCDKYDKYLKYHHHMIKLVIQIIRHFIPNAANIFTDRSSVLYMGQGSTVNKAPPYSHRINCILCLASSRLCGGPAAAVRSRLYYLAYISSFDCSISTNRMRCRNTARINFFSLAFVFLHNYKLHSLGEKDLLSPPELVR